MLKCTTALAALVLSGCATVTRGTTDQIQITSEPPAAEARTSLNQQCVTPCTLQVARSDQFAVVVSKPGFEDQAIQVTTKLAGAGAAGFAGNLLLGGIVGMGVDAATGATLEHVPNPVNAVLRPLPRAAGPAGKRRGHAAPAPALEPAAPLAPTEPAPAPQG